MKMPEIRIVNSGKWYSLQKRTNPNISFSYIIEYHTGPGVLNINGKDYEISDGDISFNCPGDVIYSNPPTPKYFLHFMIYDDDESKFTDILHRIPYVFHGTPEHKKLIDDIFSSIRVISDFSEYIKYLRLSTLIVDISQKYGITGQRLEGRSNQQEIIYKAIYYMRMHICDDLSVDEIANAIGYSTTHLNRLFKQYTKYTPYRFFLREKIMESRRLMLTNDMTFVQIAERLGFCSSSNFYYEFRKISGMTPTQFRKLHSQSPYIDEPH